MAATQFSMKYAEAAGLVPLKAEETSELDKKVAQFVEELAALDSNSPEFGKKVDQLTAMGRKEIAEAAGASNRFLDRPVKAIDSDTGIGATRSPTPDDRVGGPARPATRIAAARPSSTAPVRLPSKPRTSSPPSPRSTRSPRSRVASRSFRASGSRTRECPTDRVRVGVRRLLGGTHRVQRGEVRDGAHRTSVRGNGGVTVRRCTRWTGTAAPSRSSSASRRAESGRTSRLNDTAINAGPGRAGGK